MATPSAPQNLKITFPQATEAVFKWSAPVNTGGSPITEYEVNATEGAILGPTWIPTKSAGLRGFVGNLARGTEHTFAVRARNAEGVGPVSNILQQHTPIASLHNALFFKDCVNLDAQGARVSQYGSPTTLVREAADNDFTTFTTLTDLAVDISVNGNPTRVDAFFLKSKGVRHHSGTPSGGTGTGWTHAPVPATIRTDEGTEVSTTVAGFQHQLLLLDSHFTATSVRLQFSGTPDIAIYEIMLIEFGIEMNANGDFTEIAPDKVDRTAVLHTDTDGGILRADTGLGRERWEVNYVAKFVPGRTLIAAASDFLHWREHNKNCVFFQEPSRYPERGYPAAFMKRRVPVRLRGDSKSLGDVVNFQIGER